MEQTKENWKDVPWYEWLYQASDKWRVKSFHRDKEWTIIKNSVWKAWYLYTSLSLNWHCKTMLTHRVVMLTFIWKSILQVNHIDWIKNNNNLSNLEYCTASENMIHWFKIWLHKKWKEHHCYWLKWWLSAISKDITQYSKEWKYIRTWNSLTEAAEYVWTTTWLISSCCNFSILSTKWFTFRYWKNTIDIKTKSRSEVVKWYYVNWIIKKKKWKEHYSYWLTWKLNKFSLPVYQYSKEWIFINDFESIGLAWKHTNTDSSSIVKNLKWKYKTAWWFIWKYNKII